MTAPPADLMRAAIASNADEDRHALADWWEANGDPLRARVTRLGCELATLAPYDVRRLEVSWELAAATAELGERWRDELPVLDGVEWLGLDRGLAGTIRVDNPQTLVDQATSIRAAAPITRVELKYLLAIRTRAKLRWLRSLRIPGVPGSSLDLTTQAPEIELDVRGTALLGHLHGPSDVPLEKLVITGSQETGDELAKLLTTEKWAEGLKVLAMGTRFVKDNSGYGIDPRLGEAGARSLTKLHGLEELDLDRHPIGAGAVGRLLGSLPSLRVLSVRETRCAKVAPLAKAQGASLDSLAISRNELGFAGISALAKGQRMAELQRLVVAECELDSACIEALVSAPWWSHLRVLDLSQNPLKTASVRRLADAPAPAHLHTLRLADADLDDRAGEELVKIPWLGQLVVLDVSGNVLGRGAGALRTLEASALRSLDLSAVRMERSEAAALSRFWPRLVSLNLGANPITDFGLERFATTKTAALLQTLRLYDCGLTDDGLELLERARAPRLRELDLAGNAFGAGALARLLRAPIASKLESLDLSRCKLDAATIAMLASTGLPPTLRRLNLLGIELDEKQLVALAESTGLEHVADIQLAGTPWTYAPAHRELLAARFGTDWYQRSDDD